MKHAFVVTAEDDGLRLDQVIAKRVLAMSRRKARAVIDAGGVFVDRARTKVASRPVKPGQAIEVNLGSESRAQSLAPIVVFSDEHLIIADKPAGLVTAPTPVITLQPTREATSIGTPSGMGTQAFALTNMYSANADMPANWSMGLPFSLILPMRFNDMEFEHSTGRPVMQRSHFPQD